MFWESNGITAEYIKQQARDRDAANARQREAQADRSRVDITDDHVDFQHIEPDN